jgi:Mce-associated membrane protein
MVDVENASVAGEPSTTQRIRRRASRAAGPPKTESADASDATVETLKGASAVKADAPAKRTGAKRPVRKPTPIKRPPRRRPHRVLVLSISFAAALLVVVALSVCVIVLVVQQRNDEARQARAQRFIDTATQTVVNMFSYRPDNIDESVNRFYNGTSGPLRGMLSANNNVDNLKGLFRSTNATSEAIVSGAALEAIDSVADNASVLVSVRVTVADMDGVNKPSQPYRLRVIVHEDEAGRMTGYDVKYPDGGN